ncbi:MAG: peptidase M48 [Sphingobacteriia bacterium]|nr:peptidase M48 [Sphingobacteriia bacterium]NCC40210.1 peptidase M48 [Gammaproteobacteria bacterium]
MNFFQHQDRARRRTRLLVLLFALAVMGIVAVIDLFALLAIGVRPEPNGVVFSSATLRANLPLLLWVSLLTIGVIVLASLVRTLTLRGGGGSIARSLGAVLVMPDTTDPQLRRLRNVVEEMSIAAGVPVPQVYLLEEEDGINAFAAGYTPADAAITITRGALESLSRTELQGVVAHELSHILNGDMRLNIRLIGILFGILVLAVIGRLMVSARHSRGKAAAAVAMIGAALVMAGYIGLFFGRLIQASVSRQREFLADASAVQFTREPAGIAGALKKIGASASGSTLHGETQEIAHMLFASGMSRRWLATHPPLVERIRAIEPNFDPSELERIRQELAPPASPPSPQVAAMLAPDGGSLGSAPHPTSAALDADRVIAGIARPDTQQIRLAADLTQSLPAVLTRAAYSTDWVVELICALLLSADAEVRERQLLMITTALTATGEQRVTLLQPWVSTLATHLRLPLLEIAFPTLRRRPQVELTDLMALIERLIHADGRVEVFEYALARLLGRQIQDVMRPSGARSAGDGRLGDHARAVHDLLIILAIHGNPDQHSARSAYAAGLAVLAMSPMPPARIGSRDWPERLDQALVELDALRMSEKERLLRALVATTRHAGVNPTETELLRVIAATLHVPMPILT